jgi:DNA-binding transcriptional regulator/RsmH inhibitor MraZ
VFFSTVEKQLDAKRRMVLPAEFREAASGPFGGVFCFPSIEADCIEGGGQALFDTYKTLIDDLPFGDPLRTGDVLLRRLGQVGLRHRRPHHPAGLAVPDVRHRR